MVMDCDIGRLSSWNIIRVIVRVRFSNRARIRINVE